MPGRHERSGEAVVAQTDEASTRTPAVTPRSHPRATVSTSSNAGEWILIVQLDLVMKNSLSREYGSRILHSSPFRPH